MKSRTSSFNGALFRKNVTRFAPAWALYTLFTVLTILLIQDGSSGTGRFADNLGEAISIYTLANFGYALLVAQLLFGDLFNSRLCNALHALPMRRDTWFGTHVITGICFALVPTALAAAFSLLFLGQFSIVALYFLAGVMLSYLFFFGTAVFAIFCVGNRFAMVLVYGLLHFVAMLLGWIIDVLYQPLVFGIQLQLGFLMWLSPCCKLMELRFVEIHNFRSDYEYLEMGEILPDPTIVTGNWWYLILCAVIGIILLVAALSLYRRRNLECAGDFVVVKPFAPIFLVLYTLAAGTLLQLMFTLFMGYDDLAFLFIGMAVGFFTGLMLMHRTTRVFRKKSWLQFGLFVAGMALTLFLTWLDPIGFTRYVPDPTKVVSASVTTEYQGNSRFHVETLSDIQDITQLHQHAIDLHLTSSRNNGIHCPDVYIRYTMADGSTVNRFYYMYPDDTHGQMLRGFMSRPEVVLVGYTDLDSFTARIERIQLPFDNAIYEKDAVRELIAAMVADCEANTMAQDWRYHGMDNNAISFGIEYPKNGETVYVSVRVYEDAVNTRKWMTDHGYQITYDDKYPDKEIPIVEEVS